MLLHTLLRQCDPRLSLDGLPDLEIRGVVEDSRLVTPGTLFIARSGTKADGTLFLGDALARGAAAAVVSTRTTEGGLPQVVLDDVNAAASILANQFSGQPSEKMSVLGVTGTNGKTTTTYLLRHILAKANVRCGLVGTVEIDDGRRRREATMTTPSATEIAGLLAAMRDNICPACAMEVSSHALDQGRVAGVAFAGAAFTNLTGDHLDYHKTMEAYAAAKARLFASLDERAVAVVNADSAWTPRMLERCRARIIRFGFGGTADYQARLARVTADGSQFVLVTPQGQAEVSMRLIGRHNMENALAAAALAGETFGLSAAQISTALRDADGAPGRLQPVRSGQPFAVLVDYAHTDDALENVLTALRPLTRKKLRVLFGCGGDRDRTKRPRMARIAERLADVVYVTSDNPRTENAQAIIDEVVAGLSLAGRADARIQLDRRVGIAHVLSDAQEGDIVLLAGKGHENYQIIGTEKRHFDDAEEAKRILQMRYAA